MKKILSSLWSGWKKIGLAISSVLAAIFLTIFYFSFFALFAIPFKIFGEKKKNKTSNFLAKKGTIFKLEEFKDEF